MRRRGRKRIRIRSRHTPLRMTSMMDILTVLLLFLLKSFVVEGEVITPVAGVELPESSSETTPQSAIVIAIFEDNIMIDSELIASISDEIAEGDMVIDALADRLVSSRKRSEDIARRRGEDPDLFEGQIAIQGDREIAFEILQRVMYTCNVGGYENISLAVVGTSG
jgi:biopolymer transport protein ExbD